MDKTKATENDFCPVCKEDPDVCGYHMISGGMMMMLCCKRCGVLYIPKSLREAMSDLKKEIQDRDKSRIIVPQPGMVAVGPNRPK